MRNSAKTPLLSCLLEGPSGTGKTAIAASLGIDSDFPFVKVSTDLPNLSCGVLPRPCVLARSFSSDLDNGWESRFQMQGSSQTPGFSPASMQIVSAENYVGYSEAAKLQSIAKVFDDAYKVRAATQQCSESGECTCCTWSARTSCLGTCGPAPSCLGARYGCSISSCSHLWGLVFIFPFP